MAEHRTATKEEEEETADTAAVVEVAETEVAQPEARAEEEKEATGSS